MSAAAAVPQPAPPAKPPRPKLIRGIRGLHHNKTAARVRQAMQSSKWNFLPLIPDLFRASSGAVEAAILTVIHFHSLGEPRPAKKKPSEWTPTLTAEDIAKETGLSAQEIREKLAELATAKYRDGKLLRQALILRESGTGQEAYHFKLDYEAIRNAGNAFQPRAGAFQNGEERENIRTVANATSEPVKVTEIPPASEPVPVHLVNKTGIALTIQSRLSDRKGLVLDVSASRTAAQEPHLHSGAAEEASEGKVRGPSPPRKGPQPEHTKLSSELAKLDPPILIERKYAELQARKLTCPVEFFLEIVRQRVARAQARRKTISGGLVPHLVDDANKIWAERQRQNLSNVRSPRAEGDSVESARRELAAGCSDARKKELLEFLAFVGDDA